MKNDRIKNDRIKSDRIKSGRIKSDRIKTDRIKRITDPSIPLKTFRSTSEHVSIRRKFIIIKETHLELNECHTKANQRPSNQEA
jgi:hypothetical protein